MSYRDGISPDEQWRDVPGWEGLYEVSSLGQVRSLPREIPHYRGGVIRRKGRILVGTPDSHGYPQVSLFREGRRTSRLIHSIVADAFLGPRPTPAHEVAHTPGSGRSVAAADLRWATHRENVNDSIDEGTHPWTDKIRAARRRDSERNPVGARTDAA